MTSLSAVQLNVLKLNPSDLTAQGLGDYLAVPASVAFRSAAPDVKQRVGRVKWAFAYPAWVAITSSSALRILIRVVIELAVGIFVPPLYPFVRLILDLLKAVLSRPVSSPLGGSESQAGEIGKAVAELITQVDQFRRDPRTRDYVEAVEKLLLTPHEHLSPPARAGIAANPTEEL